MHSPPSKTQKERGGGLRLHPDSLLLDGLNQASHLAKPIDLTCSDLRPCVVRLNNCLSHLQDEREQVADVVDEVNHLAVGHSDNCDEVVLAERVQDCLRLLHSFWWCE